MFEILYKKIKYTGPYGPVYLCSLFIYSEIMINNYYDKILYTVPYTILYSLYIRVPKYI